MKYEKWNFLYRSDEIMKAELTKLSKMYDTSIQEMISYLLQIAIMELEGKELYQQADKTIKFLEKNYNIK